MRHATGASNGGPLRVATLSMIANTDYLALARTAAMHVGALLALPLAQVADLRLAVDEACACFLDTTARRAALGVSAVPDVMELSFDHYPAELHVTVRAAVGEGWPAVDELGGAVLRALVGDACFQVQDGVGVLTLIQPLSTGEG
jgi:serine/threonine-protein kinase RsbW